VQSIGPVIITAYGGVTMDNLSQQVVCEKHMTVPSGTQPSLRVLRRVKRA